MAEMGSGRVSPLKSQLIGFIHAVQYLRGENLILGFRRCSGVLCRSCCAMRRSSVFGLTSCDGIRCFAVPLIAANGVVIVTKLLFG